MLFLPLVILHYVGNAFGNMFFFGPCIIGYIFVSRVSRRSFRIDRIEFSINVDLFFFTNCYLRSLLGN